MSDEAAGEDGSVSNGYREYIHVHINIIECYIIFLRYPFETFFMSSAHEKSSGRTEIETVPIIKTFYYFLGQVHVKHIEL